VNTGNRFLKKENAEEFVAEKSEVEKEKERQEKSILYSRCAQWIAGILFFGSTFGGIPVLFILGEK
jgi:hypothetical protein